MMMKLKHAEYFNELSPNDIIDTMELEFNEEEKRRQLNEKPHPSFPASLALIVLIRSLVFFGNRTD